MTAFRHTESQTNRKRDRQTDGQRWVGLASVNLPDYSQSLMANRAPLRRSNVHLGAYCRLESADASLKDTINRATVNTTTRIHPHHHPTPKEDARNKHCLHFSIEIHGAINIKQTPLWLLLDFAIRSRPTTGEQEAAQKVYQMAWNATR